MTTTFIGIPVEGSIIRAEKRVDQRPMSELTPLFEAVLADMNVARFGWHQYTPYFNDGDPCVFSVWGMWADPVGGDGEDSYDDDQRSDGFEFDERWGKREVTWDYKTNTRTYGAYEGNYPATYDKLQALDGALQGGHFDNALLEVFGDHAEITVLRDKIIINEYSHD